MQSEPLNLVAVHLIFTMCTQIAHTLSKRVNLCLNDSLDFRDGKAVCSFCDQVIIGNVKITFNEPHMTCHEHCLKVCIFCLETWFISVVYEQIDMHNVDYILQCGVCAKALGDLVTPIFLHDQVIHCGGCFAKALKAWSRSGMTMSTEKTQSIMWLMCCLGWEPHHCYLIYLLYSVLLLKTVGQLNIYCNNCQRYWHEILIATYCIWLK